MRIHRLYCSRATALALLVFVALLQAPSLSQAQTVYFERSVSVPSVAGHLSSIPTTGTGQATITDLYSSLNNTASGGVAIGPNLTSGTDSVYFSDISNSQVLRISSAGTAETVVSVAAGVVPRALTVDTTNNFLYIMDRNAQEIVRIDLNGTLPTQNVEVFVSDPNYTGNMRDMKFNPSDGNIYWGNNGQLLRAPVSSSVPVSLPETITFQNAAGVFAFDFDSATPQLIYFSDTGTLTNGVYTAQVTPVGSPNFSDQIVLDLTGNLGFFVVGLALDKNGSTLCLGAAVNSNGSILCGDRSAPGALSTLLQDPGDQSVFGEAPSFLAIESASAEKPDPIVHPDTVPTAPEVAVNIAQRSVTVTLQPFTGADLITQSALSLHASAAARAKKKAPKAKIGFRYEVELQRTLDENGNPINSKSKKDLISKVSKRNEVTFKNLSGGSTYSVAYRVQITSKKRGKPLKVVKRTPTSPSTIFKLG